MDEIGDRCKDINEAAIKWAYDHSSESVRARYDKYGLQLTAGKDLGPFNDGPSWIWRSIYWDKE